MNVVLVVIAIALALIPMRASAEASVQNNTFWLLQWWLPSLAFLLPAMIRKRSGRWPVLIIAVVMYFGVFLMRPVCDKIPAASQSSFETAKTLDERAQLGEPFRRIDGTWYQCKSWLSRQLFF